MMKRVGSILVMAVVVTACTSAGDPVTTTSSSPVSTSTTTTTTLQSHAEVTDALRSAVTPIDHDTSVASQQLERRLSLPGEEWANAYHDCLAENGLDPADEPLDVPSADDPVLVSNWQFPDIDALGQSGFPEMTVLDIPGDEEQQVISRCWDETSSLVPFHTPAGQQALEAFVMLRGEWERVLLAIDSTPEVVEARRSMTSCLIDSGVPDHWAQDEIHFLSYVDEELWAAEDKTGMAQVSLELGKLYAGCASELTDVRIDRRVANRETFLADHAALLQVLADALVGNVTEDAKST